MSNTSNWHRVGMDPRWTKPIEERPMRKQNSNRGMCKAREFNGVTAPSWARYVTRYRCNWYFEESLDQDTGQRFMRVDSKNYPDTDHAPRYGARTQTGYDYYYELPQKPRTVTAPVAMAAPYGVDDGVMPPVPTRELYYNVGNDRRVELLRSERTENVNIRIVFPGYGAREPGVTGASLSPETALDLASDLTRMALAQKRGRNK